MASVVRCFASRASLFSQNVKHINRVYTCNRALSTSYNLYGRKYSEKHEWVEVAGNFGTIGITNYAQDSLGDIVYAQLPEIGNEFSQGEECGALESVKAASELYSPVSGKVTDVNIEVEDQPGLINKHCYEQGWLFKMELAKPEEVDELMEEEQYEKFVKTLET